MLVILEIALARPVERAGPIASGGAHHLIRGIIMITPTQPPTPAAGSYLAATGCRRHDSLEAAPRAHLTVCQLAACSLIRLRRAAGVGARPSDGAWRRFCLVVARLRQPEAAPFAADWARVLLAPHPQHAPALVADERRRWHAARLALTMTIDFCLPPNCTLASVPLDAGFGSLWHMVALAGARRPRPPPPPQVWPTSH